MKNFTIFGSNWKHRLSKNKLQVIGFITVLHVDYVYVIVTQ